jgi:hypothetical protein
MSGGPAMPAPFRPLFTLLMIFSGVNKGRFYLINFTCVSGIFILFVP